MFKGRSTVDIVVILLTLMVGICLVLGIAGIFVMKLTNPAADTKPGSEAVINVITTLVGALVGFVGGRAQGRMEANGNGGHTPRS